MQIRLWGIPQENTAMINLLQRELKDKIKIISSPYTSKINETQRIYMEIDLQNRNYRKHPIQKNGTNMASTRLLIKSPNSENATFNEDAFFAEIEKRINPNC